MEDNIAELLIDSVPLIEEYSYYVERSLTFKGKTLDEWSELISTPSVHEKMSVAELHMFNIKFIETNQIVMSNYAYAKSYYEMSVGHYNAAVKKATTELIDKINSESNKKLPGVDALERLAGLSCVKEQVAMDLCKMFYEFWKIHSEKMKGLDSRLTNLSYILRN